MSYQAPLRDMRFVLHELFDIGGHCALLGNGLDRELIDGVLEEGARYAAGVVAPLNRNSDEQGCRLDAGRVNTPEGFAEAYRQYVDNARAQNALDEALADYQAKLHSATFYFQRVLPRASGHREALLGGADCLMVMPEAGFAF